MKSEEEITCIICPIGCKIQIKKDGEKIDIKKGWKCKRGIEYARNEAVNPRRVLTTSILVENGKWPLVSVKTNKPIPKDRLLIVLDIIKNTRVKAPIRLGDKLIEDIGKTGVDVVATKTILVK